MITQPRLWTDADDAGLRAGFAAGLTDGEIAVRLDRSPKGVAGRRKVLGLLRGQTKSDEHRAQIRASLRRFQGWTAEEEATMRDLAALGYSDADIAEQLHRSPGSVQQHRLLLGIVRERAGVRIGQPPAAPAAAPSRRPALCPAPTRHGTINRAYHLRPLGADYRPPERDHQDRAEHPCTVAQPMPSICLGPMQGAPRHGGAA